VTIPQDVAQWMLDEVARNGCLQQAVAAHRIVAQFGARFTYKNYDGGLSVSRAVLKEFRNLTGDAVVWEHREKLWRKRPETI